MIEERRAAWRQTGRQKGPPMSAAPARRQALLLRPAALVLAARRLVRAAAARARRRAVDERGRRGSVARAGRIRRAADDDVRLVRHGDRRVGEAALQPQGGHVVPLEHGLVHLLRGDVLQRVLRRALLRADPIGAGSRQPDVEAAAVAGLRVVVADARPVRERAIHADGRARRPAAQHDHPAHVGIHADASPITRSGPAIARSSRSGCSRRSSWASRSWDSRRTSTSTRITRST